MSDCMNRRKSTPHANEMDQSIARYQLNSLGNDEHWAYDPCQIFKLPYVFKFIYRFPIVRIIEIIRSNFLVTVMNSQESRRVWIGDQFILIIFYFHLMVFNSMSIRFLRFNNFSSFLLRMISSNLLCQFPLCITQAYNTVQLKWINSKTHHIENCIWNANQHKGVE